MSKLFTAAVIITSFSLLSCGGNDTPEIDKSIMPAADTNKSVAAPVNNPAVDIAGQPAAPAVVSSVPDPQMARKAQTISAGDASKAMPSAGLNPAHGQPGHRCDIAVGAPLSSAPAVAGQPKAVQTVSAPATTIPAPSMPANPNAKLNPAHGQPGHDCAIPVGAPLKG
jgi:hypothetical protein